MLFRSATLQDLRYSLTFSDNFPNALKTDESKIRQILFNIIGNAIKFTDEGAVEISVIATESKANKFDVLCTVKDTGIGISEEDSKYIFEAFKQSDEKSNKKYSGTGLGLTISKRLCDILGAELTFISKAGIGTIFNILLKDLELSHSEIVSHQSTFHFNEIQFKNQLLLIVDDSDSNIIIVKKQLAKFNLRFAIAKNGYQAINQIAIEKPNIIVMDYEMPGLTGVETAKIIHSNPDTMNIPIIIATAHSHDEAIDGVDGITYPLIFKPIIKEVLVRMLTQFIEFTSIEELQPLYSASENICDNIVSKCSDERIISIWNQDLASAFNYANSTLDMDDIQNFINLGIKFAIEENLKTFENCLIQLQEHIKTFNVIKIMQSMEKIKYFFN